MKLLQKDWDYNQRLIFILLGGILCCFIVAAFFLGINEEADSVMFSMYHTFYFVSTIYLVSYPVSLFKLIFPKQGTVFTAPNITAMLPVSKKELLFNKMMPAFIFMVVYLVTTTGLYKYYELFIPWSSNTLVNYLLFVIGFACLFNLHFVIGIMTKFSRPIEWLKILVKYSIRQAVLISVLVLISVFVPVVSENIYVIGYVLILGYAVLEFIRTLPLLEEIYQ
ncbi:MAG TPA: hypothetical protein DCY20_08175 [Firmicutes bacterium]|nr:hypothetical protein [Bacillota bacterium]